MIDPFEPSSLIRYDRTRPELEELLLFSVCVAGKSAGTTVGAMEKLYGALGMRPGASPFRALRRALDADVDLPQVLRGCGFGCFNQRTRTLRALLDAGLDLRTCGVEELERIPGIGMKTARFFLLYSRPGVRVAVIDTHIRKYLALRGHEVPERGGLGRSAYLRLEAAFLREYDRRGARLSLPEFDLAIWSRYAVGRRKAA